jgi:hypothetical protein
MNIFTMYKRNKETTKMISEFNTILVKDTLDELNSGEYSDEQREQLVDSTKRLLDANAEMERSHAEYEFSAGMLAGVIAAMASLGAGAVLGRVISCITKTK